MDDATATLFLEQKLPGILNQLRKKVDLIIIDGPAILSSADAVVLATMADGVALVIDARHEKLPILMRATDLLKSLAHTSTGLIMNRLSRRKNNPYYATAATVASTYHENEASEQWIPAQSVQTYSSNGNGQKLEPVVVPMMPTIAPSPSPVAAPSSVTPSLAPGNPPMMPAPPNIAPSPIPPAASSIPMKTPANSPNGGPMMQMIPPPLLQRPRRVEMTPPPPSYPER
jgi:Mrp family chromosome partitioning ATPase